MAREYSSFVKGGEEKGLGFSWSASSCVQRFKRVAADATGGAIWANDVSHFLEVFKVRSSSCGIVAEKDALDESRA